ncbi:MAG: hemolysin family protein [Pyrinomonadaceae bacterium]
MFTFLELFSVLLLVAANGFFVASEFALISVRRSRVATLANTGNRRAERVLHIVDNLNSYISATQLGVTLASLGLGWIGEPAIARLLEQIPGGPMPDAWRHGIAVGVAFATITVFHIVLGELVPKTLALQRAERVALAVSLPISLFYKIFNLPVSLLYTAGAYTARLIGLQAASGKHVASYTEDELRQLVDLSHQSGHLEAQERLLINRVFDFTDAEIREAMIPRTEVAALPVTATLEEAEDAFCKLGYSRLPVYREHLDDILGVLFLKELLPCLRRDGMMKKAIGDNIESLVHQPMFITSTARLGMALKQMQTARTHLAFVVDEHGGIEGIVTLEDLLEEIVGEISDEHDEETKAQIVEEKNGTFLLDGMLAVRDINRRLKLKLPEDASYTTLAGFLLDQAGRLLRAGESVEYDGAQFTVESLDRRRIRRIRFSLLKNGRDNIQNKSNGH